MKTPEGYETVSTKWIAGIVAERDKAVAAQQFVNDAAAYLRFAFDKNESNAVILTTLAHDIHGLAANVTCFSPRVSGYAMKEAA